MEEGKETAIESGKTKVKPKGLFCVCASSLKVYRQAMCATKGLFAEKCSLRMNDFAKSVHRE